jgi:hypothetical protein
LLWRPENKRGADEAEPLASCTLMTRAAHS